MYLSDNKLPADVNIYATEQHAQQLRAETLSGFVRSLARSVKSAARWLHVKLPTFGHSVREV